MFLYVMDRNQPWKKLNVRHILFKALTYDMQMKETLEIVNKFEV